MDTSILVDIEQRETSSQSIDPLGAPQFLSPSPLLDVESVSKASVAGGILSSLEGCGSSSSAGATPANPLPASVGDAGRFLAQATLGFNRSDLTALQSMSYADWIDSQFLVPRSQGHYDWLVANGYDIAANINLSLIHI